MLPFATKTDMLGALKNKDVKIATVKEFLHSLQCEHGLPNVRDQLRRLWTKYVRELYSEEEDAESLQTMVRVQELAHQKFVRKH